MEPVYLAEPVFTPRPISPLYFEHFEARPEDIIIPGTSDNDGPEVRARKKRKREAIGAEYLRQQAGYRITFRLKGPFEHGWKNPWGEHGVLVTDSEVKSVKSRAARHGPMEVGARVTSPIDLTSEAEVDEVDKEHSIHKEKLDKQPRTQNRDNTWLSSNVHRLKVGTRVSDEERQRSPSSSKFPRRKEATTFICGVPYSAGTSYSAARKAHLPLHEQGRSPFSRPYPVLVPQADQRHVPPSESENEGRPFEQYYSEPEVDWLPSMEWPEQTQGRRAEPDDLERQRSPSPELQYSSPHRLRRTASNGAEQAAGIDINLDLSRHEKEPITNRLYEGRHGNRSGEHDEDGEGAREIKKEKLDLANHLANSEMRTGVRPAGIQLQKKRKSHSDQLPTSTRERQPRKKKRKLTNGVEPTGVDGNIIDALSEPKWSKQEPHLPPFSTETPASFFKGKDHEEVLLQGLHVSTIETPSQPEKMQRQLSCNSTQTSSCNQPNESISKSAKKRIKKRQRKGKKNWIDALTHDGVSEIEEPSFQMDGDQSEDTSDFISAVDAKEGSGLQCSDTDRDQKLDLAIKAEGATLAKNLKGFTTKASKPNLTHPPKGEESSFNSSAISSSKTTFYDELRALLRSRAQEKSNPDKSRHQEKGAENFSHTTSSPQLRAVVSQQSAVTSLADEGSTPVLTMEKEKLKRTTRRKPHTGTRTEATHGKAETPADNSGKSEGEQAPIITTEHYDQPIKYFHSSSVVETPRGQQPYTWLSRGKASAEDILRQHLVSVSSVVPNIESLGSSKVLSSQNSPISEEAFGKQGVNAELTKSKKLATEGTSREPPGLVLSADHPIMPASGARLEVPGLPNGHNLSRKSSVDSVDTEWRKDHSDIFAQALKGETKSLEPKLKSCLKKPKNHVEAAMGGTTSFARKHRTRASSFEPTTKQEESPIPGPRSKPRPVKSFTDTKSLVADVNRSDITDQHATMRNDDAELIERSDLNDRMTIDSIVESRAEDASPKLRSASKRSRAASKAQAHPDAIVPTELAGKVESAAGIPDVSTLIQVVEVCLEDADPLMRKGKTAARELAFEAARKAHYYRDTTDSEEEVPSYEAPSIQVSQAQRSRRSSQDLLATGPDVTTGSPQLLPASTNLSEFEYQRVHRDSRSAAPERDKLNGKVDNFISDTKMGNPKRRISFTPDGHIKQSVEIHVPKLSFQDFYATRPLPAGVVRIHSPACPLGNSESHSEDDPPRLGCSPLPEAQIPVDIPAQLPLEPSMELLETDKQSLKFLSTEENEASLQLSTQAELAKAQLSFQQSLQSPAKTPASSSPTKTPRVSEISPNVLHDNDNKTSPFRTSKDPYAGASHPHSSSQEVPSTQAMVDAMSPFAVSTVKKPARFLNALTRPAAAIFGYIGWGGSSQQGGSQTIASQAAAAALDAAQVNSDGHLDPRVVSAGTSIELPPAAQHLVNVDAAVDFGKSGLDMETSSDAELELGYQLSQPPSSLPLPRASKSRNGRQTKKNASPLELGNADESDFEDTMKSIGSVRDDKGRWASAAREMDIASPAKMTLRSSASPVSTRAKNGGAWGTGTSDHSLGVGFAFGGSQAEGLSQDGQRGSAAVDEAIEAAGSFLGTWDVDGEARRLGGSGSGSVSGGTGGAVGNGASESVERGQRKQSIRWAKEVRESRR
ncbi:hypothetical protein MMC19_002284 [Ptychographa xylographoides]|nr:hypothetical protein [Ptychographa xylographoides]